MLVVYLRHNVLCTAKIMTVLIIMYQVIEI